MVVRELGLVSYDEAWRLQLEMVNARAAGEIPDTLLALEHFRVFTLGKRLSTQTAPAELGGIPVRLVERGGEVTYHGPGQLVMYPIFLLNLRTGPKALLRLMENAIVATLARFGIEAYWIEGKTGVWLRSGASERKIASLGIAVRRSVSYHGLALNINNDLAPFHLIQPCGFAPSVMTNMAEVLGKEVELKEVQEILAVEIFTRFVRLQETPRASAAAEL